MTTFTTEDRISSTQYFTKGPWPNFPWTNAKDYRQTEIEFFFPLTEQIPLGLDYTNCEKQKLTVTKIDGFTGTFSLPNTTWATVSTTTISPQLTITPNNSVGEISIGGIRVGLEKKPTWLQRKLHKLLGFNWKDKER